MTMPTMPCIQFCVNEERSISQESAAHSTKFRSSVNEQSGINPNVFLYILTDVELHLVKKKCNMTTQLIGYFRQSEFSRTLIRFSTIDTISASSCSQTTKGFIYKVCLTLTDSDNRINRDLHFMNNAVFDLNERYTYFRKSNLYDITFA